MHASRLLTIGAVLLLGLVCSAQEFPKFEAGLNYTYARYAPSSPYSKGHSLNGGGGSFMFNVNDALGLKIDLQGFGSNSTTFNIAPNPTFPRGAAGQVQGNLFTYMFGPEIKYRPPKLNPYLHILFGAAHTNVYGKAFRSICQPVAGVCSFSKEPSADAFAMAVGGGIDIPINKTISFRPGEVDYFLTRFENPFSGSNNQNNFRYSAGIVFTFGEGHY
jgi:Outer membrane protein beta-barrel domain